jgi:hypothetical protein
MSVLAFLAKFQQNSLLDLGLAFIPKEKLLPFLSHVLPQIQSIKSIDIGDIQQFYEFYEDGAKKSSNKFLKC